jgi:hypothetical protein
VDARHGPAHGGQLRTTCLIVGTAVLAGCGSDSDAPTTATPDARAQALAYATDNLPCTSEADCCVVFDGCRATSLIVAAVDKDKVASLLATASKDMCVGCIAPAVQVKCVSGKCSGVELIAGSGAGLVAGEPARVDHCGAVVVPTGWSEKQSVFDPPPGLSPAKTIGCGP